MEKVVYTLEELAEFSEEHPYHCHTANYYSNDASTTIDLFADFIAEYDDADTDMNLVFRYDIEKEERSGYYRLTVFFMGQRKGIYWSVTVKVVTEPDAPRLCEFLQKHFATLKAIITPF